MKNLRHDLGLPGIETFQEQEQIVTDLINQLKTRLDPEGQALLLYLLKTFARFVVNGQR